MTLQSRRAVLGMTAAAMIVALPSARTAAVSAALEHVRTGRPVTGHLARRVDDIAPSARETKDLPGDWVENTVRTHVTRLRRTPAGGRAFEGAAVPAHASLDTGKVRFDRI
ncbi:hypothetical protein [Streptomyces sp. NPDC059909]|uniref:hypothetical protein n=1 Tax=Streptomyces sp. NPDC059909 TaxID=3346998 RepID=UPI00364BC1E7